MKLIKYIIVIIFYIITAYPNMSNASCVDFKKCNQTIDDLEHNTEIKGDWCIIFSNNIFDEFNNLTNEKVTYKRITSNWPLIEKFNDYSKTIYYIKQLNINGEFNNISLLLPIHYRGVQLYFNNEKIYESRKFLIDGTTSSIIGKPDLVIIPDQYVKKGINKLIIRTSPLNNNSGFSRDLIIGTFDNLKNIWLLNIVWYFALSAIMIFITLYFLFIFLQRNKEKFYLYFSISSLSIGLWILGYKGYILLLLDFQSVYIVSTYLSPVGIFLFNFYFLHAFLSIKRNFVLLIFEFVYLCFGVFIISEFLLTNEIYYFNKYLYQIYMISILFVVIYGFYLAIIGIIRKREYSKQITIGISILGLSAIISIFRFLGIFTIEPFVVESFFLMSIVFANILASRYAKVHTDLEKSHSDLLVLDKIKDDFLATTSHELRTPLHGIIGLSDSLIDGSLGEVNVKQQENISLIKTSASHLNNLVNDILDFSKIRAGKADLYIEEVSIDGVILSVVSLLKQTSKDKKILFNVKMDQVPKIRCDRNRMRQVMVNLISNALKFTKEGEITIITEPVDQKFIRISVADTGIGIEKGDLDRIWNPFEQAQDPNTRIAGGAGLGLAITRYIIELHGGTIFAESEPGKGSTFTVEIPIDSEIKGIERTTEIFESVPAVSNGLNGTVNDSVNDIAYEYDVNKKITSATILAVDDDPVNLKVIENICSKAGYSLKVAVNGPDAIKLLEEDSIDLVLLDLMLPGMSGYEVTQNIRAIEIGRYVPIIMVTARDQLSDLVKGFKTGANDYITKPFNSNELLVRIESQLAIKYMLDMEKSVINGLRQEKDAISSLYQRSVDLKESTIQMVEWENIIREDLNIAQSFQLKLMTHNKKIQGIDSHVHYDPLMQIGGDIYDIFEYKPGVARILLADATGHGITASLNTIKILSEYAVVKESLSAPEEIMNHLNQRFYQVFKDYQIVFTIVIADIDVNSNSVSIAMAGHPEQYMIYSDNARIIKVPGPIIGISDMVQYRQQEFDFSPGTSLFLYSDGLFEYFTHGSEVHIQQSLMVTDIVNHITEENEAGKGAKSICKSIIKKSQAYDKKVKIDDDITVLVIKRTM